MNRLTVLTIICFTSIVANSAEPLVATPVAPSGARGLVTIESGEITLELQGLLPGSYDVVGRSAADQMISLGLITIIELEPIRESVSSGTHQTQILSCRAQIQLPQGLSSTDLKQVLVQDQNGTILLKSSGSG